MKTFLIISFLFLFLYPQWSMSQTPDSIIDIDFEDLKPSYKRTLKLNSTFNVKLSNINRNLYKVDGIKAETTYNAAVPAMLTGIKLPTYLYQANSGTSMAALPSDTTSSYLQNQLSQIKSMFEEIKLSAKKLDNSTFLYNDLAHLSKSCQPHNEIIRDAIKSVQVYYPAGNGSVSEIRTQLERYLWQQRTDATATFNRALAAVDKYEKDLFSEKRLNYAKLDLKLSSAKDELKKERNRARINSLQKQIAELEKDMDSYPKVKEDAGKEIEKLRENLTKAEATIEEMRKFEKEDKIFILLKLFDMLQAPGMFEFTSDIIKMKTDEVKYTITIEPTELNMCAVNSKKVIEVTVKAEGGIKLDFSTGVFISGGSNDFLGQTYYYEGIDADNRKIMTAERNNRNMLSIGALMHLYKRSTDFVKWGGSVGVSTTASFTDLNFHAGPSLFFGKDKNRVVLSTGLALRSSNILDNRFSVGQSYSKTKTPDAIPTVTQFPIAGYFFSLTYNFTKMPSK